MGTALGDHVLLEGGLFRPPTSVRLVLADELTLVREGLAAICRSTSDFEVVGQCSDGSTALRMIEDLAPDVALLDWVLPETSTLDIARLVRDRNLPTKIGVLSTRGDRKTVLEALRSGVSGFLLKSGPAGQVFEAIRQMLSGTVYISPVLSTDAIFPAAGSPAPVDPFETLSPREFQVFTMLVDGVRAKEIAARLGLSPKTIDTYRSSLMQKLQIFDVAGLVKYAIQRSFVSAR